ncbi:hypothetical protein A3J78_02125 [Candidatus Beckwithbacteria bacterium RBG_13_35_6]|uniref:Cytotoxin n=1 Tax=Candidatus Beckwithbacteria bacterium RBG_13_35_6 TaxID=1797456 RepID=A0A1F5DCF0_9BACT|nr:MAG: hypothetical protein A3J78_02125 [Candidatus Beckwithbacteria bacterium RBG_13_35_6]
MEIIASKKFDRNLLILPKKIQLKAKKKLQLFVTNIRHPSLNIKKMKGHKNVWEGRIDNFYRFTFLWTNNTIILRTIGPHDKALK